MIRRRSLVRTGALAVAAACGAFAILEDRDRGADRPDSMGLAIGSAGIGSPTLDETSDDRPSSPLERAAAALAGVGAPGRSDCRMTLSAEPRPMATVLLRLDAPCHGGEVVTFQHEALAFTMELDDRGGATARVPAFRVDGDFFAFLPDGEGAMAEANVPTVEELLRVGGVWPATAHAMLRTAEEGEVDGLDDEGGGLLLRLGDGAGPDAIVAEVYQRPMANGPIDTAIEFDRDPETCGRSLSATMMRQSGASATVLSSVSARMPDCGIADGDDSLNAALRDPMLAED